MTYSLVLLSILREEECVLMLLGMIKLSIYPVPPQFSLQHLLLLITSLEFEVIRC